MAGVILSIAVLAIGSVSAQQAFAGFIPGCTSSEYFDGGKCVQLTECNNDEFESTPPTANSDRVCAPLTECLMMSLNPHHQLPIATEYVLHYQAYQ